MQEWKKIKDKKWEGISYLQKEQNYILFFSCFSVDVERQNYLSFPKRTIYLITTVAGCRILKIINRKLFLPQNPDYLAKKRLCTDSEGIVPPTEPTTSISLALEKSSCKYRLNPTLWTWKISVIVELMFLTRFFFPITFILPALKLKSKPLGCNAYLLMALCTLACEAQSLYDITNPVGI